MELILFIGEKLPVESRIVFALTSCTIMFKIGGIRLDTSSFAPYNFKILRP
jgi:hypothetical protein